MNYIKCLLGMHNYEVMQQEEIKQVNSDLIIGKIIISRCVHCGKIKQATIKTVDNIYIG